GFWTIGWIMCVVCILSGYAAAQTGVSDDRVSLPEGPGSLEGVGENVSANPNMGSMSYSVPIRVPAGFGAVTPSLSLSYNSSGGSGLVGMGWTMDTPFIERMTYRGLPEYDTEDDFCANGSSQLVRLPNTNPPVYRARYESEFVRYTWMQATGGSAANGSEGYWVAEYTDGSVGYFGATAGGTLVPEARVSGDAGTFRYMLVEKVDVYGHKMVMSYIKDGFIALPDTIGYVYADGENPTYAVTFSYQPREDDDGLDYLSDAKAGFNELLTQRLRRVQVWSRGVAIRQYLLTYEGYADTGGFTRLARVETLGVREGVYPVAFDFAYSEAAEEPVVVDMGSLGINMSSGRSTLLDINGDALPDLLDTTDDGAHRFFINTISPEGEAAFESAPRFSNVNEATGSGFRLGAPGTQILDTNGDGFTDLINAATGTVLLNKGNGDWETMANGQDTTNLNNALQQDFDQGEGELRTLKFIDYNNDKQIDVMRSTQDTTTVFENSGNSFVLNEQIESSGAGFAEDGLQFTDMNGDGMLDVVRVR
ncbi:MAG: SpvB/TcaC N-terminal domain-containing protein, partial [Myxococcota bacterium]